MKYKISKNLTGGFDIIEKQTNVTIQLEMIELKAKEICRKLNLGSGFDGWTPEFVSVKYPLDSVEFQS